MLHEAETDNQPERQRIPVRRGQNRRHAEFKEKRNELHTLQLASAAAFVTHLRPFHRVASRSMSSSLEVPTGLRLCGMVEEPPRPGPAGSAASPTSICIMSEMSRAALAKAPTTSAAS